MPRQGQLRIDQINKAKRYCDFTLIVKGETSSVLSESLRKLKGTGYNRNFLLDWKVARHQILLITLIMWNKWQ